MRDPASTMASRWSRRWPEAWLVVAVVCLAGCGGGSSEPTPAVPPPPAATLDSSFGVGGIVAVPDRSPPPSAVIRTIAVQPDGSIVAAGSAVHAGSLFLQPPTFAPALVRYNSDGTLDLGFGNAGTYAGPPEAIRRIALQPDGKIIALAGNRVVMRINADGSLDVTFGSSGTGIVDLDIDSNSYINDLALQSDGRIVLAGYRQLLSEAREVFLLLRLAADGTPDNSFGRGVGAVTTAINEAAEIVAMSVAADGAIVATGAARHFEVSSDNNIVVARYDANGTPDMGFGVGGVATAPMGSEVVGVRAMTLEPDGRIIVAGDLLGGDDAQHSFLARFLADGALDLGFGTGGIVSKSFDPKLDSLSAVALQADGKIVTVGYAGTIGYAGSSLLTARFDNRGIPDPSFGTDGTALQAINGGSSGFALAIQPDGRIVAAGGAIISETDQRSEFALVRYLGDPVPAAPN